MLKVRTMKTDTTPQPGSRVTIADIAQVFGVSAMTVSKALNRKPGVSPQKADAIISYAKRLGYRPSQAARSLLKGRTNTVGICIRESDRPKPWGYPWVYNLIREIGMALKPHGMYATTSISPGMKETRHAIERFLETGVESVIIGPLGELEQYHALADLLQHCPHVLAFDAIDDLPIDHVKWNTYLGGQMIAGHFNDLGHRRLMVLGASERELRDHGLRVQLNGMRDAARILNLELREEDIVQLSSLDDTVAILKEKLSQNDAPTAVFCHNDWVAMHAIQALTSIGIRVPEDVSITGFDNLPVAALTTPAVTSVGYDIQAYAQKICEIVTQRISSRFDPKPHEESLPTMLRWQLEPQLIVRQSTSSPRSQS